MHRRLCHAIVAAFVPALGLAAQWTPGPPPGPLDTFEQEVERYRGYLRRASLGKRTDGRIYFARTGDPRALDILLRDYAKPEEPKDHVRYLLASIIVDHFEIDDTRLTRWHRRHGKPVDAWMWFETLRHGPWRDKRARLLELSTSKRTDPYCRAATLAAAVRGLSEFAVDNDACEWAAAHLGEALPTKPIERALVVEGIASMVLKKRQFVRDNPGWKELCRALIRESFDSEKSIRRTKVVVASYLARTFDVQNLGFEAVHWNVELDRTPNARRGPDAGTTSSVGFAGIRTKGDRIVFVVDASDSMLKRVSNRPGAAQRGPATGGSKAAPEKGVVPTADDLDWSRIRTRFDAAREFLRVSLATLNDQQKFAVVLFGDVAKALDATPTLKKASPQRIRNVLKELWTLKILPPTNDRPDGRLRGTTNFHGGMRLAYRMTKSGITKKAEFADNKSMLQGCDTIFVMTDGVATTDDWREWDDPEPHDRIGDPETGVRKDPDNPDFRIHYQGPYGRATESNFLLEDIERLNLVRRCEIHCVGIGEADHGFLQLVAKIGNGEALKIDERLERGAAEK